MPTVSEPYSALSIFTFFVFGRNAAWPPKSKLSVAFSGLICSLRSEALIHEELAHIRAFMNRDCKAPKNAKIEVGLVIRLCQVKTWSLNHLLPQWAPLAARLRKDKLRKGLRKMHSNCWLGIKRSYFLDKSCLHSKFDDVLHHCSPRVSTRMEELFTSDGEILKIVKNPNCECTGPYEINEGHWQLWYFIPSFEKLLRFSHFVMWPSLHHIRRFYSESLDI